MRSGCVPFYSWRYFCYFVEVGGEVVIGDGFTSIIAVVSLLSLIFDLFLRARTPKREENRRGRK